MVVLTRRQREILMKMRDEDEEIIAYGLEVWCGLERISYKTLYHFLANLLVSNLEMEPHYYHINECGKLLLEGCRDIYRMSDGRYVEDWTAELRK